MLFGSRLLNFVHQSVATTNQGLRPLIADMFVLQKELYDNPPPYVGAHAVLLVS